MRHFATPQFWEHYNRLPKDVRELADKNFKLLKADPRHPSLHFRRVDGLWSVRVGAHYRALGLDKSNAVVWFWIGPHAAYDELLR